MFILPIFIISVVSTQYDYITFWGNVKILKEDHDGRTEKVVYDILVDAPDRINLFFPCTLALDNFFKRLQIILGLFAKPKNPG